MAQSPQPKSAGAARSIFGRAWSGEGDAAHTAFASWTADYGAADAQGRKALLAEGIRCARERRAVLAKWIKEDPERALAATVPFAIREQLPEEVLALLEERISGEGDLSLIGATPKPGGTVRSSVFRKALIGRREFFAYTYGRRSRLPSISGASISGIAIDDSLAVLDSPVRVLEAGETANGKPVESSCPVSGVSSPVNESGPFNLTPQLPTAIETGGKVVVVCEPPHIGQIEARMIQHEHGHRDINLGNNLPGTSGVSGRPAQSWTHGTKKLLIIRVDFDDLQGVPTNPFDSNAQITETYAVNVVNNANGVRDYYEQASFGKTSISIGAAAAGDSPDVTAVLRMPEDASYYAADYLVDSLHSDARALAAAQGFNLASYDRIGVVFKDLGDLPGSQIDFGGLGGIESKNFWVNGWYAFELLAHEIGHNYGLNHANLWEVPGSDPIAANGSSDEYGDIFDIMGNGSSITHHFSHWNKSLLQWIPDTAVSNISSSGTYRVFRFDHQNANLANSLALKIVRNRDQDYWIGLRRATTNASLDGGAHILWGYNENREGDLLDLTAPYNDLANSALAIGATLTDSNAGITIHPVAQGGSGADEWIDVQVTLQSRISWAQAEFIVDEQVGDAILTLNRAYGSTGAVSVNYATSPGTATAPADYTTKTGTVTWADGDTSPKTINIAIAPDALVEGTQSFTVTLSGISGAIIVDGAATTVTIADPGARDGTFMPEFVNSSVQKILVLPDGGSLLGGWFDLLQDAGFTQYDRAGITRINPDGTIDPDFASEGGVAGGAAGFTRVVDMARQPDGKIVVVGEFTTFNGVERNRVVRLEADGTVDSTFNPGTGANDEVHAVLVQTDGKIVIGGAFTSYNGTAREYLARLNTDGTIDTSFVGPNFGQASGWEVNCLALQADGKILVGGVFYLEGTSDFRASICRVLATGALDATFNGVVAGAHVSGNTNSLRDIFDIEVEIDGRILIAGRFTAFNNTARTAGVARLTSTGALDASLAPTGNGTSDALLLQPDGRLLVVGRFTTFNGVSANRIVRLSTAGVVESGFVAAGGATTPPGNPAPDVTAVALQPDGKILIGGDHMIFQGAGSPDGSPYWRFFGGLPGLPGTLQFTGEAFAAAEGSSAQLTVSRTGGSSGTLSIGYGTVVGTATAADFTAMSGVLTWTNGDTASKTITVPITSDALSDNGETFLVNLGDPRRNSSILGAVQRATVTITTTAYESWVATNFTPAEAANSSISGVSADPDGDGLENFLEFAFNLPPKSSTFIGRPVVSSQNVSGTDYLTITFRRRISSPGLSYTPLTNGELPGTWMNDAVQVGSAVNNGDGTETVTYRDNLPLTGPVHRFMRVQVTQAPQ